MQLFKSRVSKPNLVLACSTEFIIIALLTTSIFVSNLVIGEIILRFKWSECRKVDCLADMISIGYQHGPSVNRNANTSLLWHTIFLSQDKILIHGHSFLISGFFTGQFHLKSFSLIPRII